MSLTHITYQTHPDITRLTGVMGGGGDSGLEEAEPRAD